MRTSPITAIVAAVLCAACAAPSTDMSASGATRAGVAFVEFLGMPAPETADQRAKAYTTAKAKITYRDSSTRTVDLAFGEVYNNVDQIDTQGNPSGTVYDGRGNPILDPAGKPYVSQTPDANSLLRVGDSLYLVTHFEYQWIDSKGDTRLPGDYSYTKTDGTAGTSFYGLYGNLPGKMNLAKVEQNGWSGELRAASVSNIDFSRVGGLWIPCAGSLSPWNTHLGSEEYEPDARCIEKGDCHLTYPPSAFGFYSFTMAMPNAYRDGSTASLADKAFDTRNVSPYNYGLTPEITIKPNGNVEVAKHRALGRVSREKVHVMEDQRTAFQGDDGTYNVLTMFIADRKGDLSAGTLYAAKWMQASAAGGGAANLMWYRLGHATDDELATMANALKFSDIFDAQTVKDVGTPVPAGYHRVNVGHERRLLEDLRLKPGMEKAAAFLETRRYAAYVGATTEFEKFEGVAGNAADRKLYAAMTRMRSGMQDSKGKDPVDHIKLPVNNAGAVYELNLRGGQRDADGNAIPSDYVPVDMKALVVGEPISKDAVGNTAHVDKIASPDNLWYSEKMGVLFIGEDSSLHVNNFLWAYHVYSGKLERILSLPAGAESTGLQVVENEGGFAYIMSNYQHAGDFTSSTVQGLKDALAPMIDKYKASVGYIGGLPALK
jgi:secreted PhoX family phosphatase